MWNSSGEVQQKGLIPCLKRKKMNRELSLFRFSTISCHPSMLLDKRLTRVLKRNRLSCFLFHLFLPACEKNVYKTLQAQGYM